MSLFRKILEEYEEEPTNPCGHKRSKPFVWDGQTLCYGCCKHEYKDLLETCDGETTCMPSRVCWPTPAGWGRLARVKKPASPKIRVFDENGKRRRVRYHPEPKVRTSKW